MKKTVISFLSLYFTIQILLPLRHVLYPGEVSWTEEGHLFSWHMKLRDKVAQAQFLVRNGQSGQEWVVDPLEVLPLWQVRKMVTRPDMILQFAHYLQRRWKETGKGPVEVYALVKSSLHGRKPQMLIDPSVDLTTVKRTLRPCPWILPLVQK